jgi:hypothetical protein
MLVINTLAGALPEGVNKEFFLDSRLEDYVSIFNDQGIDYSGLRSLIQPDEVRETAFNITINEDSDLGKVRVVHSFIRDNVVYKQRLDYISAGQVLLEGWGDCSEMSLLAASMLESLGFKSFITNGQGHVFVITMVNDSWVIVDPTLDFQASQETWINYLIDKPYLINSTNTLIASCPTTSVFA